MIYADISKLYELDEALLQIGALVRTQHEQNVQKAAAAEKQLNEVYFLWKEKKRRAEQDLEQAKRELEAARQRAVTYDDEGRRVQLPVPECYYTEVARCNDRLQMCSRVLCEVAALVNSFVEQKYCLLGAAACKTELCESIVQKGSRQLHGYCMQLEVSKLQLEGKQENAMGGSFPSALSSAIGSQPRILSVTQQTWSTTEDGGSVFDSPLETAKGLIDMQGGDPQYLGTCGICACANLLRMAGVHITEKELVTFASTHKGPGLFSRLCVVGDSPENNGGTSVKSRRMILKAYGMDTVQAEADVHTIAECVAAGKGVIVSVYAGKLDGGFSLGDDMHAMAVTSVTKDAEGNVTGFYVCDTNGEPARYCTAEQLQQSLTGKPLNVTHNVIR